MLIVFLLPYFVFLKLFFDDLKSKFIKLTGRSILVNTIVFTLTLLIVFFFLLAGDTSWDGANRHAAISLLIRDNNGIWGWDLEYFALWGFNINHVVMAMYLTIFGDTRFLIVNNIIIFSLFINFVFVYFKKFLSVSLVIVLLISFPITFHQLSSTYVDLSLGIFASVTSFGLRYLFIRKVPKITFLPFVFMLGYTLSIALQSFLVMATLAVLNLLNFINISNFSLKSFLNYFYTQFYLFTLSTLMFVSPFLIRNFFEKGLVLYPFGTPFTSQKGILDLNENQTLVLANIRSEIPSDMTGPFEILFFQYIYSPWKVAIEILLSIRHAGIIPDYTSNSLFYRSFIYDNRLNGFGISILLFALLIFLFFYKEVLKPINLVSVFFLIGIFWLFPQSVHARYMIGIPLFLILIFSEKIEKLRAKHYSSPVLHNILIFLVLTVSLFSSYTSLKMYLDRIFPFSINARPSSTHSAPFENTINPACGNLYFVGHIQWYQILWGSNGCGKLIDSIDYKRIGPIDGSNIDPNFKINKTQLVFLIDQFLNDNSPSKTFLCTLYQDSSNTSLILKDLTNSTCTFSSKVINSRLKKLSGKEVQFGQIEVYGVTYEYTQLFLVLNDTISHLSICIPNVKFVIP
jgi:hypothetical protein